MNQKNFQPKDFSPIHYYPEKPTKKGWYISCWGRLEELHRGESLITEGSNSMDFWYWDGINWCTSDSGESYTYSFIQERDWFGLNHAPKFGK